MSNIKPNLFIGSSSEARGYVQSIKKQLEATINVKPWYDGVFKMNQSTMDDLEAQLQEQDFAVFILAPDDVVSHRGKTMLITRDNTVFEMGLFWGQLGRKRVFFIVPDAPKVIKNDEEISEFRILSDLTGLTSLTYDASLGNKEVAVMEACIEIKRHVEWEGGFVNPAHHSLIRFLTQFSKDIIEDPNNKYVHLAEAIRTAYDTDKLSKASVTGVGIWEVNGSIEIKQVAGNVGKNRVYKFEDYPRDLGEGKIPGVVDAYYTETEQLLIKSQFGGENIYLICYPIGKKIVVAIHVAILGKLLPESVIEKVLDHNLSLMSTINYILGGDAS